MVDVQDQIVAVGRRLGLEEREGREARVVVASQTYETTVEDLWDAVTSAERIPRWFMPVSGDLRLGGRYQLEGNAGGTVLRCEPPKHLALTWEFGGEVGWVDVHLTAEGPERATLELRHAAHIDDERWNEFGPGAVGIGWDLSLLGLSLHLAGDTSIPPEQAAEWSATDEARQFMISSGRAWLAATIAAGDDEAAATAAAERCIGFYTGAEPPPSPDGSAAPPPDGAS